MLEKIKNFLQSISKKQWIYFWITLSFAIIVTIILSLFLWKEKPIEEDDFSKKLLGSEYFEKEEENLENKYIFRVEKVAEVLSTNERILEMRDEVGIANTFWIVRLYPSTAMKKIRNERLTIYNEEVNKFCSWKLSYKDFKEKDRLDFYKKVKDIFDNRYFLKIELGNTLYQTFKYECQIPSIHTRQMLFREAILYAYDVSTFEVLKQKDVLDPLIRTWTTDIKPRMIGNIIYKQEHDNVNLDWKFFQDVCVFNLEKENIQKLKKESYAKTFTELNQKVVEDEEKKFNEQLKLLKEQNPNVKEEELKKEIWNQNISLSAFSDDNEIIPMTIVSLKNKQWNKVEETKCRELSKKVVWWYMAVDKEKTITQQEIKNFINAINKNPQLQLFLKYSIKNNKYVPIDYYATIEFSVWNKTDEELISSGNDSINEQVIDEKRFKAIQDWQILDKVSKQQEEFTEFPVETEIWPVPKKN